MNIVCTICSNLINQAENIYMTKCGHIFHKNCLFQSIARSKTCPQCRNNVTKRSIFRIYPTIPDEVPEENAATLQSRLDEALLQLRKQTKIFNKHKDLLIDAQTQKELLQPLMLNKNAEILRQDATISNLERQLMCFWLQQKDKEYAVSELKKENEIFKKNIQTLNSLQTVLNATSDDVEQMLENYTDIRSLKKFTTALKRELCESGSKETELRDRLKNVKHQLNLEEYNGSLLEAKLLLTKEKAQRAQEKYENLKEKREDLEDPNSSFINDSQESTVKHMNPNEELISGTVLNDTNTSFASEYALLNSARNALSRPNLPSTSKTSIFHKKEQAKIQFSQENDLTLSSMNISYDGL